MTMTELFYVRLLVKQQDIFSMVLASWPGACPLSLVMGPDLALNRASQPQYC